MPEEPGQKLLCVHKRVPTCTTVPSAARVLQPLLPLGWALAEDVTPPWEVLSVIFRGF